MLHLRRRADLESKDVLLGEFVLEAFAAINSGIGIHKEVKHTAYNYDIRKNGEKAHKYTNKSANAARKHRLNHHNRVGFFVC